MFKQPKDYFGFLLMVLVHLCFSYGWWWWQPAVGTLLIIGISRLFWKIKFLENIGFKINQRGILVSGIVFLVVLIFSNLISTYIAQKTNTYIQAGNYINYIHGLFYTLNEEIVLGAVLIFAGLTRFRVYPLWLAFTLAIGFSLMHFVFYKWLFLEKGIIQTNTLLTLVMIGWFRNNLIIFFQHIGYTWAIHFGWIAIMLDSNHFNIETGSRLTELECFNIYLGSIEMLAISSVLAILSTLLYLRKLPRYDMS